MLDISFLPDPYPAYRALREAGPVVWRDDIFQGAWILTHHADVALALKNPVFSSQRTAGWIKRIGGQKEVAGSIRESVAVDTFQRLFGGAMVFLDGDDHRRLRKAMAAGFHPSRIRSLRPHIEMLTDELLDPLEGTGSFDFMASVGRLLPSRVIGRLLGVDRKDETAFLAWSEDLARFIGALQPSATQLSAARNSLLQMVRYFEALLPARRQQPGDDLVSRLLLAQDARQIQPNGELIAQCAMVLFAGHETTRNLLGNGLYALLSHPLQWDRLQADPGLMTSALQEMLRFDSPVQYTGRRVTTAIALHGKMLRRGDLVLALIGAANRDPACFSEPDVFAIDRSDGSHLSFGSGPHVCIGAGLALLEGDVVFRALMRRWPTMRLDSSSIRWNSNPGLRGLQEMRVSPA